VHRTGPTRRRETAGGDRVASGGRCGAV